MIIDALANMELYQDFNEKIYKGLTFLKETDVAALPAGRYDIDGDNIYAFVQEYETKPLDQCRWEAHYKYTDIQYVVQGGEKMGYTNIAGTSKTEDRPGDDVYFLEADGISSRLKQDFSRSSHHKTRICRESPSLNRNISRKLSSKQHYSRFKIRS